MAVGKFDAIRLWDVEAIRVGTLPMPYVQESALLAAKAGAPCLYDSSRQLAECSASFSVAAFILQDAGSNSASAGTTISAWPITPDDIFAVVLNEAWALNLQGNSYGLLKDATTGYWYMSTADTGNQMRIIGAPASTAIGDTKSYVLAKFNLNNIQYYNILTPAGPPVAATVTAHSGGTQAAAFALTATYNRVSVAAALGDSVRLPASAVGSQITIDNRGANPIRVFGAGTETINGITTTVGVAQGINTIVTYTCAVVGDWETSYVGSARDAYFTVTGDLAINSHTQATYILTKGSAAALTLAAPTTGAPDDGIEITIISNSAFAHVLTATGLLGTGSASVNVATFGAFPGASIRLMAIGAKWVTVFQNAITFS